MRDNEIISLFEMRDEHAIEVLSDKYHPYCYKNRLESACKQRRFGGMPE